MGQRRVGRHAIDSRAGNTFAKVLRAFLRQDPDVMMIGEIRDLETAEIAVQAALTGHFVFSTLHTNDAAGAVMRLIDMNVAPYLLASTATRPSTRSCATRNALTKSKRTF